LFDGQEPIKLLSRRGSLMFELILTLTSRLRPSPKGTLYISIFQENYHEANSFRTQRSRNRQRRPVAQANALGPDAPPTATQSPTALTNTCSRELTCRPARQVRSALGPPSIDAVSNVVCPGTSGNCLIHADQVFQIGNTSAAGRVAIIFKVDGVDVDSDPFNGDTLANHHFTSLISSHGITVPHGTHTVQTVVFTEFAAQGGNYAFQYKVYKP